MYDANIITGDSELSEKELVGLHIENCKDISWGMICDSWRDEAGNLCVSYGDRFYHYNVERGEWW